MHIYIRIPPLAHTKQVVEDHIATDFLGNGGRAELLEARSEPRAENDQRWRVWLQKGAGGNHIISTGQKVFKRMLVTAASGNPEMWTTIATIIVQCNSLHRPAEASP